jgi:hypothetical protein
MHAADFLLAWVLLLLLLQGNTWGCECCSGKCGLRL